MHRVWSVNAVSRLAALLLFFGFSCEASVGFTRRQARVVERAQSSPAAREHQQPEFATSASGLEAELRSRSRWEQDGQQFALGPRRIRFANGIHHAENRLTFPVSRLIGGHGSASSGPTQGGGAQLIVTKRSSLLGEVVTLMSKNANEDTAEIYRKTESASTPTPLNAIPLPDADDAT